MVPTLGAKQRVDTVLRGRFRGCLLGGAVGDALGAPVEFLSKDQIRKRFGESGIQDYVEAYGRIGAITDDTQMTMFTGEGLIRSYVRWHVRGMCSIRGVVAKAYQRWLRTQDVAPPKAVDASDGWLIQLTDLHHQRAPGRTCLTAIRAMQGAGAASNSSKGCGGVMRVAPVGMFAAGGLQDGALRRSTTDPFELAMELAGLTHGHPTGQLAAGMFADVVSRILLGTPLAEAVHLGLDRLRKVPGHEETSELVERACTLAARADPHDGIPAELGEGWVAEESLAIAVYAALAASDFESAIVLAVNHGGDSDSTGSIAGNLLGAALGEESIPSRWLEGLELRPEIAVLAEDLADMWLWDLDDDHVYDAILSRYPG